MKKYIIVLFALAALLSLSSCNQDRLDIPQKGVSSYEAFYKTDDDAIMALNNMMANIQANIGGTNAIYNPYYMLFNVMGDDMLAAGEYPGDNDYIAAMNEFRYDPTNEVVTQMYQRFYYVIYHANLIIDNFGGEAADTATKKRAVAEARVVRAWAHMMLAMGWGTAPTVDHVLAGDARPENSESQEAMLLWAAKEASEAAADCEERTSPSDKNGAVKITRGFANAVAGKAYVYAGKWAEAKTELKKVIDSKKYELVPGTEWYNQFHVEGDGSPEKVFEVNVSFSESLDFGGYLFTSIGAHASWMQCQVWNWRTDHMATEPVFVGTGGWGGCTIDPDYAAAFYAYEPDSYRRKGTFMTDEEFLYEMEWVSDSKIEGEGDSAQKVATNLTREQKEADPERGIATYLYGVDKWFGHKKVVTDADFNPACASTMANLQIMRYAEVLLLYAEACFKANDNAQALWAVNEIQTRAGAPVTTTVDMDIIKREKKHEMWLEDARWIDLVRWGDLDVVKARGQKVPQAYDEFFVEGKPGYNTYHKIYSEIIEYPVSKNVGFKEGKHNLFPFPDNVIQINKNIKQNAGWE